MEEYDLVVIGAGPAGQKAAVQAVKAGCRVLLVDRARNVGGTSVRFGTIPSKTLRECALTLLKAKKIAGHLLDVRPPTALNLERLIARKDQVMAAHEQNLFAQLSHSGVAICQGAAHFLAPDRIEVRESSGPRRRVGARWFVIATGSHPRAFADVPVDHEQVLDADSLLSLATLPASLTVIGSGVVACEYASTFAALGVQVTLVDRAPRPLAFLDPELTLRFLMQLEAFGGRYLGERGVASVRRDGRSGVEVRLSTGDVLHSEKLFSALGRVANTAGLELERAGIVVGASGFIEVDEHFATATPHIYAVGDVIGPPALASTAMDQARRAVCHALGIPLRRSRDVAPIAIYTIPEIAGVGLSEALASKRYGKVLVGRAHFEELVRGQLAAAEHGLLKLICHPDSGVVLGVHAVGDSASDLVHVGQMAVMGGFRYDTFIDAVFNFPTFAEAYRVAAFDILAQERARQAAE